VAHARAVGARIHRREDPRLITGRGRYLDDHTLNGLYHLMIVRSPYAHAEVRSIEISRAKSMPGVIAVLTRKNFEPVISGPLHVNRANILTQNPAQFPIAGDEVVFQGEPVAVVVADTRYRAADAAETVQIDYEPLPAAIDVRAAARPGSVKGHRLSAATSRGTSAGVGDAGTIGSSAAIVNAICDALAPFDISHVDMPASPDRIWNLLQAVSTK
jgi:aerobic carbon-monoxide dehydrogenase large subunit